MALRGGSEEVLHTSLSGIGAPALRDVYWDSLCLVTVLIESTVGWSAFHESHTILKIRVICVKEREKRQNRAG